MDLGRDALCMKLIRFLSRPLVIQEYLFRYAFFMNLVWLQLCISVFRTLAPSDWEWYSLL